jgi:hypothetical protein
MSDVLHEAQQEFWRPPSSIVSEPMAIETTAGSPAMAQVCLQCHTEFLVGSRFCHTCGTSRPLASALTGPSDVHELAGAWQHSVEQVQSVWSRCVEAARAIELPGWLHYLHFHEIKKWVGLPTASLIAFVVGMSCVAGALLVGLLTAKTFVDWQAIQFYRAEWLLAATAAFVAGILLKRPSKSDSE